MSQIDTEKDKNPFFSNFQSYVFFPNFLTDSVDWNVEKMFSSVLREEIKAVFIEKHLELSSKKTEIRKFSDFHNFVQFLSKY